ncbi:RNA polymerase sigma factor [Paenibacillus sp. GCM10027626]|uniref:RNA polymerase sigma factor n=1 Tax=Paenibacillus sp. GCM10027626 TaxID=3273411 RepID=UPI003637C07C
MEACLQLYDRYFDDVYRFVLFRVGNRWDAEDLVSDIFRKVMEYAHKHGAIPEHERAWLFAIANNRIIDHYRRRPEQAYGTDPEQAGFEQIPQMFEAASVRNDCLEDALLKLKHEERQMVQLKYMLGFAYQEMSQILHKTEDWLRIRVHRIRKKLAGEIEACMEKGV